MVMPSGAWADTELQPAPRNGDAGVNVLYSSPERGRLHLATGFLTRQWAAAKFEARLLDDGAGQAIRIGGPDGEYHILHNDSGGWLDAGGLGTDGLAVATWRPADGGVGWICYVKASRLQVGDGPVIILDGPGSSGCMSEEDTDEID
jgi:hypothetical protein